MPWTTEKRRAYKAAWRRKHKREPRSRAYLTETGSLLPNKYAWMFPPYPNKPDTEGGRMRDL